MPFHPHRQAAASENHEQWLAAGAINVQRWQSACPDIHSYSVALADGSVLAIGGWGDFNQTFTLASAERYRNGAWVRIADCPVSRQGAAAIQMANGKVLHVGGSSVGGGIHNDCYLYDPVADSWSSAAAFPVVSTPYQLTRLPSGKVMGFAADDVTNAWIYDPTRNTWTATAPFDQVRESSQVVTLTDGRVLLVAGSNDRFIPPHELNTCMIYTESTNSWAFATGTLQEGKNAHGAVLMPDGRVFIGGGYNGTAFSSTCDIYDPATNAITPTTPLPFALIFACFLVKSGRVLAAGGNIAGFLAPTSIPQWNPHTGLWTTPAGAQLPGPQTGGVINKTGVDDVIIAAGYNNTTLLSNSLVLYGVKPSP